MLAGKSPDITEETADKSKPKSEMIETSNLVTEVSKHHSTKKWIHLGIEGNGLIVVVDNRDGSVKLEDFERTSFEVVRKSLSWKLQTRFVDSLIPVFNAFVQHLPHADPVILHHVKTGSFFLIVWNK
ncbi:hypothetical protein [Paenibacillus mesotrionivorans]|uniref:Uncharacterized protein n=1 Tax=Paenibacillus mesotrionivorans TaxID=3160968 RepID=A0ACC7NS29_9BACL